MFENLKRFFFIFFTILFIWNFSFKICVYSFNLDDVKNNITYLSSDYFKGRLGGTIENFEAANYIKMKFKEFGLSPFEGNYYDEFDGSYPHKLLEEPYLRIIDRKGVIIKSFKYGIDYREEMLSFKKNYISFSKANVSKLSESSISINKSPDSFLFFVPENNNLTFRSSYLGSNPMMMSMYIMVSSNTLSQLKNYLLKDYKIECFIPFEDNKTSMKNVTAYIKGKNSSETPLVISSHFDHLGTDSKGTIYSGALDNASGVSFMLELCKYIVSLGIPNRDIIFVGFNAEEFGCLGSKHFVDKYLYKLKGALVYNFDMIGSSGVPLGIMGGRNDSNNTDFMRSVTSTAANERIKYNSLFEDASDHESFREKRIDAITFCDSDMSKIHTPNDKSQYISNEAIDRCFKVVSKEIIRNAFSDNPVILYNNSLLSFSLLGLLISIILMAKIKK